MDMLGIPLFSALQSKLGYLSERQKVIAQNVANASTPGYTPQDLKPFEQSLKGGSAARGASALAQTDQGIDVQGTLASKSAYASVSSPDSETTLNGNQVVLEEQMLKMSDTGSDYQTAVGFYQKALSMLHQAVHKPGS